MRPEPSSAVIKSLPAFVSRRWRHLHEALWKSALAGALGAGFAFVSALTWARDEFFAPDIVQRWTILKLLPQWRWEGWLLFAVVVLFVALFEGSLRRVYVAEQERDRVQAQMAAVTIQRDLSYKNCAFVVDHEGNLVRFALVFANLGTALLQYRLTAISLRRVGYDVINITPDEQIHFVHRGQEMQNQFNLTVGFRLTPLPSAIEIGFTAEYDNVPGVLPRVTERVIRYDFSTLEPLAVFNTVTKTDER